METNGWDTISVLNIAQVNQQLQARLSQLIMSFSTSWVDGFSGSYSANGTFGPWSITGGSDSDIYLTLPITSGTLSPSGQSATTDISGMSVTVVINLEWVPSAVESQVQNLQFALNSVTAPGGSRPEGGIYVLSTTDPNNTGFGGEVGAGIAQTLLDNTDKITYIFAQTGVIDTTTATWLQPVKSTYSYQTPQGGTDNYLAILSVTSDRDISALSANIDSGIASAQYPLAFVVSGDLFLQNVILPALPGAFPNAPGGTFTYVNSTITIANPFNLATIQEAAIGYVPTVTAMVLGIDANALHNVMSGSVYLDLPAAYLMFSSSTVNVLTFDPTDGSFTFAKDPNPVTGTSNDVPWYDYLLTLGAVGAAVTAIVVACLESGLSDSLSGANLAGSLATAPATTVRWAGLDQVQVVNASLNDAFLMLATVN